tara:strand:+ start:201 stop:374 length:174 start_codon:yes stop_codon:yes gene_type:complete
MDVAPIQYQNHVVGDMEVFIKIFRVVSDIKTVSQYVEILCHSILTVHAAKMEDVMIT